MSHKVFGIIAAAALATLLLVFFFVPPTQCRGQASQPTNAPAPNPTPAAATAPAPTAPAPAAPAPAEPSADDRYRRAMDQWEELAKLYKDREAAKAKVDGTSATPQQKEQAKEALDDLTDKPLPPPPQPNDPKSLEEFEKWNESFEEDVQEQQRNGGLGSLIGVLCPMAAAAYGAPEAAGLCGLIGPLLDGLGISLGEGDDIQEVGAALFALEQGDYGPMRELLRKHPELASDMRKFIESYEEHHDQIRETMFGTDAEDPLTICSSVMNAPNLSKEERRQRLLKAMAIAVSDRDKSALQKCLLQL